jgi:hypothetical protein
MVTVPYISAWSEETTERPHRVLDFLGRVAYHDKRPSDRDEHGVLSAGPSRPNSSAHSAAANPPT